MKLALFVAITCLALSANASCLVQNMNTELKEIESSPYWNTQKKHLLEKLNSTYLRKCPAVVNQIWPGLKVVSEDYEIVGTNENRMFEETWNYSQCDKAPNSEITFKPATSGFLKNTIQMKMQTPKGSISSIVNSCSPKEALANMIAISDLVLSKKTICPPVGLGGSKEADIVIQAAVHNIMSGEYVKKSGPQSSSAK